MPPAVPAVSVAAACCGWTLSRCGTRGDFRLLFSSRTVTLFGTEATEVALLVQAKQLTGSTVAVGLLGAVELVPLVVFGLYGGVLADRFDRRQADALVRGRARHRAALLMLNALPPRPAVWPLYVITALMRATAALQRPSLDASMPRVRGPGPAHRGISADVHVRRT